MPPEPENIILDNLKQWKQDLACPVCYASLRFESANVVCTGCLRTYPLVDGIPVLIAQRANESSKR